MDKIQIWCKVNGENLRFDWSGGHGVSVRIQTDNGLIEIEYFNVGSFEYNNATPGEVFNGIQNQIEYFTSVPYDFRETVKLAKR